jgi:C-terminal processing protease CtpA/Prc
MGVIFLSSFLPKSMQNAFIILKSLVSEQLKDTDSLLFDVRNNGGGYVTLAHILPQLFSVRPKLISGRAIVHPTNAKLFEFLGKDNAWSQSLNDSQGKRFTEPVPFDDYDAMTSLGTQYLKPVGVLTNANCYSACDLFSAAMQDSVAATIFGEDG